MPDVAVRRRHGGITERVLAASASAYVVSPAALGPAAIELSRIPDRMSAAYLIALATRAVPAESPSEGAT